MKIIAIETSHDDTSVVLYENKKILKEWTHSQADFHKMYGGTVPELASRRHMSKLMEITNSLLKEDLTGLDHIAYTDSPGLIGSLHMGRLFAKALSLSLGVKAMKINHMFAHIFAVEFTQKIVYPAIALIVSGGHTQLWDIKSYNDIKLIGETKDDAAGEAFDKVARVMGLGFPGGPKIDKLFNADLVDNIFDLKNDHKLNFSFSGIKTKIKNYVNTTKMKGNKIDVSYVASNFQNSIVKYVIEKTNDAIKIYNPKSIVLGGGVAANSLLRNKFKKIHKVALVPAKEFTTDNAKMIAIRSAIKENKGMID